MLPHQHPRDRHGVPLGKGFRNNLAGAALIIPRHLLSGQMPGTGHRAIKRIGMGRAVAGQVPLRLGKHHRIPGMGVDYGVDLWKAAVQLQMGQKV